MVRPLLVLFLVFCYLTGCHAQADPACELKGEADYLSRIGCKGDFDYIKGKPLTEKFGYAQSIKIVYRLRGKELFFTNSSRFPFHYDFCTKVLGETDELADFNYRNYRANPGREYILSNLNYYSHLNVYALELMAEDNTSAKDINEMYSQIAAHTYFPDLIKVLVSSPEMEARLATMPSLPIVRSDDIYKGRQFVSLNKGGAYGYLRKVDVKKIDEFNCTKRDIVILNGLPNQLPVVSGVITVPFQTPLCHISLLCINRGTPNSSYRKAWTDPQLAALENKLVYYEVNADTLLSGLPVKKKHRLHGINPKKENPSVCNWIPVSASSRRSGILILKMYRW